MKLNFKRLMAMFLSIMMVVGMLPTVAFAEGGNFELGGDIDLSNPSDSTGGDSSEDADSVFTVALGAFQAQNVNTLEGALNVFDQWADNMSILGYPVITLNADYEMDAPVVVDSDYPIEIDLNGHKITYNSTTMGESMITNKGVLTIKDSSSPSTGEIFYNYTGAADGSFSKGNNTISNCGTLTVDGGKIHIANLSGHAKYPIDNNSTTGDAILVINGGHLYNYNMPAIRLFCNSETYVNSVTINGGLVEGYHAIWMQNPGSKTVNGSLSITNGEIKSTAKAWVNGTAELDDAGSEIYFSIHGEGGAWDEASLVSITGGTINENVNLAEQAPANISVDKTKATFNGFVEVPAPATPEGRIDNSMINMNDQDEIFISGEIYDLKATESVVIKLYSGETLLATTTLQKPEYFNLGELSFKICLTGESSSWKTVWEDGMPRADYVPTTTKLYVDNTDMGSASVYMQKIPGETPVTWAELPGVNPAPAAGTAKIGDTYYSSFDDAYKAANKGDTIVLLETAVINKMMANYGTKTVTISANGLETAFLVTDDVKMGTFAGMTVETDGICFTFGEDANGYGPTVDITGGTYTGGTSAIKVVAGLVRIADGTFSATGEKTIDATVNQVNANGGKYDFDPTAYIPGNRMATKGSDGYWTVAEAAAQIGEVKYADLASAISAAQAGETVTLLRDINLGDAETITIRKNIIIDGEGYWTITFNTVSDAWNMYNAAFAPQGPAVYAVKNLTIKLNNAAPEFAAFSMKYGGTLENVTVKGAFGKGVSVDLANALTVTDCTFDGAAVGVDAPYSYDPTYSPVVITRTTFNTTGAAAILKENAVFTDNIIAADSYVEASGYQDVSKNFWNGSNATGTAPATTQLVGDEIVCDTYYATNTNGVLSDLTNIGEPEEAVIEVVVGGETYAYGLSKLALVADLIGSNTVEGATIKILADVTMNIEVAPYWNSAESQAEPKTVAINLNGKTLNGFIGINAGVTATIENGTVNNTGNHPAIDVTGTATVEDVTVKSTQTKAFRLNDGGDLTVKAGSYSSDPAAYLAEGYVCSKIESMYVVTYDPTSGKVAKIGEQYFASLADAIAAAQDGDVVKLIADINYNVTDDSTTAITVSAGKNFTLDLNGYTISGENSANKSFDFMTISSGATLIIADTSVEKAGKITYKSTRTTANENESAYTIFNKGTLILNGGTIENSTPLTDEGREMAVTVAINSGGTYSTDTIASFVMNGGTVISESYFAIRANVAADNKIDATDTAVAINGGTVYGIHFCDWGSSNLKYKVTIGDAVIETGRYPDYCDQSVRLIVAGTTTSEVAIDIGEEAEIKGRIHTAGVAAKIGSQYYNQLRNAFVAAEDNDTIVVLKDVTLDTTINVAKNVTLDLNGRTISGICGTGEAHMFMVNNGAAMTIKDSSDNAAGMITYAGDNSTGWIVDVEGALVLESGTLELTGTWVIGYAVDVRPNSWGTAYTAPTSFTMKGGKIISSDGAVRVASSSVDSHTNVSASFTMDGGEIDAAWDGIFVQQSNAAWDVLNVTINDGTIKSALNPIRLYGPAATSYVNGEDCVAIALNGGTLTYTGTETREWLIDGILRVGGGATADEFLKDSAVVASADFANANGTAEGYKWVEDNGVYSLAKVNDVAAGLSGSGTEEDPYLITTLDELILFRDSVNAGESTYNAEGVYVALGANIDMAGENWTPIGDVKLNDKYTLTDDAKVFCGTFDGKNHVLSNLKIEKILNGGADADANIGLFSFTGVGAVIKNLTITNVDIDTDGRNVGAVAGVTYEGTTLESITVNGDIQIVGGNNVSAVGGMMRYASVTATNIKVSGDSGSTIKGNNIVGGIFAEIAPNSNCTFSGLTVENVAINGVGGVGGIVGLLTTGAVSDVTVKDVTLVGKTTWNAEHPEGRIRLGSVAGLLGGQYSTIANATVENVTAKNLEDEAVVLPIIGANYDGPVGNATEAKIDDTYYATFAIAYAAAEAGDTIELLANIHLAKTLVVDKAITVNGNGKTITGDGDLIHIKADLTLNNVVMTAGAYDLTLDIDADDCDVVLNNCTVTGPFKGYGTSEYIINSGTYMKGESVYSSMLNGAVVYGGTFHYEISAEYAAPGYVVVDNGDGTWTVKNDPVCFIDADNDGVQDDGEAVYGSLEALFAENLSGEVTVVLLKNVSTDKVVDTAADTTYNFVTYVAGGVTMDWNYTGDWNYIQKASIGAGVTLNVPYRMCVWTELEVYGTINTGYFYLNGGTTNIYENAVVNANTGEATTQVKNGTVLTVNGALNTAILNVWAGASKLDVSGANAKVAASWIDIWDGTPSVTVQNGATLDVDAIKASRGGSITVADATLTSESIELGHNGDSAGTLTVTGSSTVSEIELTVVGSTVAGPEGLTVTSGVDGYEVKYADGKYTLAKIEEVVPSATIVAKSATLLYEDMIQIRYTFEVNGEDIVEYGMLVFASATAAATHDAESAIQKKALTKSDNGYYYGYTDGIAAKEMGDSQFVVGYVQLSDGSFIYADSVEYSPKIYAERMISKETTNDATKALCNALMNYGAAAQMYFNYKTDSLMNREFASVEYNESVLGTSIFSVDTTATNGFTTKAATLLFNGAITYRIKYEVSGISVENLYLEYTVMGTTSSVELKRDPEGYYYAYVAGIAAKDMDEAFTAKPYYLDASGEKVYGAQLVYSGYEYARRTIANSSDQNSIALAKAFAMYISAADTAISK